MKKQQSEATVCALWTMRLSRSVINTLTLFISFVEKERERERANMRLKKYLKPPVVTVRLQIRQFQRKSDL